MAAIPRRNRVLPAVLTATILAAAGVTVVIDVIAVQTGHSALIWPYEQIAGQLRGTHWNTTPILAVAAAIAFLGLLLITAALTRGKRTSSRWPPATRTWSPAPPGGACAAP